MPKNVNKELLKYLRKLIFLVKPHTTICFLWNSLYISAMYSNADIFKIETNHVVPARGKVMMC